MEPVIPPAGGRIWYVFRQISGQRTGNGFGPNPIQFSEILAWQALSRVTLLPWEFRAILAMDRMFIVRCAELSKPENEQVSDEPLSSAVFDRVFGK